MVLQLRGVLLLPCVLALQLVNLGDQVSLDDLGLLLELQHSSLELLNFSFRLQLLGLAHLGLLAVLSDLLLCIPEVLLPGCKEAALDGYLFFLLLNDALQSADLLGGYEEVLTPSGCRQLLLGGSSFAHCLFCVLGPLTLLLTHELADFLELVC